MKTLFKIMRSTITSLLFFLLIVSIIVQFAFTAFNRDIKKVRNLIDADYILEEIKTEFNGIPLDDKILSLAREYIDGYADYVFSKRSYPSIQTLDTKNLTDEEKTLAENILQELQNKIDLKYETVVKIRETSNFMTNGSIYLLINIGTILIFLIFAISLLDFKKAFCFLGIAIASGGFISMLISALLLSKIPKLQNPILRLFASSIFGKNITSSIYRRALIYMAIGIVLFGAIFYIDKILKKRQITTK